MFRHLTFGNSLVLCLGLLVAARSDDQGSSREEKTGPLTVLGTVQGDLTKVSEGGYKIEVKYKDLVTTTRGSGSSSGASGSARFRLPRTTVKEKNQEVELRVLPGTTIRLLNTDKNGEKGDQAKKAEKDARDAVQGQEDDREAAKQASKKPAKRKGRPLPGSAGKPEDLKKGQVVIVTVAREDRPGFSRLIATSLYVLGEK